MIIAIKPWGQLKIVGTINKSDVKVEGVPFTALYSPELQRIELWYQAKVVGVISPVLEKFNEDYLNNLISRFFRDNAAIKYFVEKLNGGTFR